MTEDTNPIPPEEEKRLREARCRDEVNKVLEHHRCSLRPQLLSPEPVGTFGDRVMMGATIRIVAEAE